ncbi:hypothetical protein CONLIGDRAFT_677925 [Coniochaeta ligniaria NRRL 30616]|uniref:Uncharacterized protein n=1 Tax=Coniochaeta ligniaria NRRL 30616 TaxID=1408157 RepID=A0A1J7J445_9PEZI|nr:hypothetical protein CONLIGDRAFT_677925 [Coniochaeta ligniaria NRRL 30616]
MDEHPESLDAALRRRPLQLRHLDIAWYDCQGNEPFIGPGGRFASLPRLVCLEKLCVQLEVLYGTDPVNLLTPLVDLLPSNIAELTLSLYVGFVLELWNDFADGGAGRDLIIGDLHTREVNTMTKPIIGAVTVLSGTKALGEVQASLSTQHSTPQA